MATKKTSTKSLPALVESDPGGNLLQVFNGLGFGSVSPDDQCDMKYRDGFLRVSVKRADGIAAVATRHVSGKGFLQMTKFDPAELSKDERNEQIRTLSANHTQVELAQMFGLSQAMIARILKDFA
jgi:hypothetical protein